MTLTRLELQTASFWEHFVCLHCHSTFELCLDDACPECGEPHPVEAFLVERLFADLEDQEGF